MSCATFIVSEQAFLEANPNVHTKAFVYHIETIETPNGPVRLLIDSFDDENDSFWNRGQWWIGFDESVVLQEWFSDLFGHIYEPGSSIDVSDMLATFDEDLDTYYVYRDSVPDSIVDRYGSKDIEAEVDDLLDTYLIGTKQLRQLRNNFKAHRWFRENAADVSYG